MLIQAAQQDLQVQENDESTVILRLWQAVLCGLWHWGDGKPVSQAPATGWKSGVGAQSQFGGVAGTRQNSALAEEL